MGVFDELFEAVYNEGDQLLRDCMDLSTATGMRPIRSAPTARAVLFLSH